MRAPALVFAALALAACDSGAVPSPAQRQIQQNAVPVPAENAVMLDGQGVRLGGRTHYFSAEQSLVERDLAKAIGAPEASDVNEECGAGPIAYSNFSGGLTVNFQNGRLVGWSIDEGIDGGVAEAQSKVRVAGDVQVGTVRSAAQAAPGYSIIAGSTLGEEFALGAQIGGFIEDDAVSMLYAGTQCFFR